MTLYELAELAKLGRKYVKEQSAKNVIAWLGQLPNESEIDEAAQILGGWYNVPEPLHYDVNIK